MSYALSYPRKELRRELETKRPLYSWPEEEDQESDKGSKSHRAFLDLDSSPKIKLNYYVRMKYKK